LFGIAGWKSAQLLEKLIVLQGYRRFSLETVGFWLIGIKAWVNRPVMLEWITGPMLPTKCWLLLVIFSMSIFIKAKIMPNSLDRANKYHSSTELKPNSKSAGGPPLMTIARSALFSILSLGALYLAIFYADRFSAFINFVGMLATVYMLALK